MNNYCRSIDFPFLHSQVYRKAFGFIFIVTLFFIFSLQLDAQVWAPPGYNTRPNQDFFSYDLGVNKYDNDYYLYVAPSFNFNLFGALGISLTVPLNLLMYDKDPKMEGSKTGKLRPTDYDEKSDYLRLINYVWYGTFGEYKPGELTYSIYAGKIYDAYLGHGTILNKYVNNQRIDVYKVGIWADMNGDFGGVQVFTNSVYDRDVNAGRVYIRPFAVVTKTIDIVTGNASLVGMMPAQGNVIDEVGRKKVREEAGVILKKDRSMKLEDEKPEPKKEESKKKEDPKEEKKNDSRRWGALFKPDSFWNRFAIGYTTAYDGKAPNELKFDTTGNLILDESSNPQASSTKKVSIEGYDAEFKVISTSYLEVTPYYDINRIRGLDNSKGTHYGVIARLGGKDINITVKPEYRKMSANYIPMYFDSFYELERVSSTQVTSLATPKWKYANSLDPDAGIIKGHYQTFILNYYNIALETSYEDYDGADNSRVFLGLYLPIGQMFRISGFYMKKGFDKKKEAFKLDDKSQGALELAVKLGPFQVKLQNRRRWVADSETGQFVAKDEQMILFSGGSRF